ncbi:MAG: hypothetical protein CL792_00905 [Chloroflexi bacterium]|nr:hypothetical protein [Chloroflexota bacterium]|tara:strand:- start:2125 stop:2679 length:555 start_codon:yes stop_codon:yes gene_type:complete
MHIGLDFDGTIADVAWLKQRYILDRWDVQVDIAETGRRVALPILGDKRYEEMLLAVHQTELVLEMPPVNQAIEVIERFLTAYDVTVVTARLDEELGLAQDWLKLHGIGDIPIVHTKQQSKAPIWIDLNIKFHLDDTPEVLEDAPESMVPVLLNRPYNIDIANSFSVENVDNWIEFEEFVRNYPF